jgi:ribonuclease HI
LDFGKRTKAVAFADDLIAIKAESAKEAENFANIEIGKITKWAEDNKIMFNEQKSKVMVITRRENTDVSIYLNNCPLEQVNSIKYLGVILDNKLNFREHLISTARKCTTLIHTLSKSAKLNWGLQQGALNTIYKGAILPLLTYAAPVWIRAMETNYNKTLYTRVQRLINIKIAKAYRTTSNEALCILTGNAPIIIKAEEAANIYRTTKDKGNLQLDHETDQKDWTHPADTVDLRDSNDSKEYSIHVYTDGSKSENGVGSGVAIYTNHKLTHQIKYKLHDSCSNNQVEQTAIIKALETLGTIKLRSCRLTAKIYTDSRITLLSLKNPNSRKNLIEEIRKENAALKRENWEIVFKWVKAHAGNSGNDLADQLAKDAVNDNVTCFNKIPKSEIILQETNRSLAKWQKQWNIATKGQATKVYFPDISERLTKKINLTPNLTAMLTAHGKTKAYLHRFKIIQSPECTRTKGDQTVDHLIYDCGKLERERDKLIAHISREDNWPVQKSVLMNKYLQQFSQFTNSIDFEKL